MHRRILLALVFVVTVTACGRAPRLSKADSTAIVRAGRDALNDSAATLKSFHWDAPREIYLLDFERSVSSRGMPPLGTIYRVEVTEERQATVKDPIQS